MTSPRPDTRYLATTPITTDLSQRAANLTASAPGGYEDPSPRTALVGTGRGRSIEVKVSLTGASDATLATHGADVGTLGWTLIVKAGSVRFYTGGTTDQSLALPDVGVGAQTYTIAVCTEPNPATTGASDALRSEFTAYCHDTDTVASVNFTHAADAVDAAGAFAVGGSWDGATFTKTITLIAVRLSARFHTRTELREHFVAATAAPAPDGIEAVEGPLLPSQATEPGAIVGPQYQAAALSLAPGKNRHRSVGPVIQMLTPSAPVFLVSLSTTVPATWVRSLGDGYATHLGWCFRRKIQRHTDWLRAQVQWATWILTGASVSVKLRLYSSDKPPNLALDWDSVTLSRTTDDTTGGLGVLEDFDLLKVRRNPQGQSWIWLGAVVDVVGATNAFTVRALGATPVSRPNVDGQAPNQWGP